MNHEAGWTCLIKNPRYVPAMPSVIRLDSTRAAELFHALSDPIRVDVVGLLLDGERCVCELMAELDLAQSRLSWHLKQLSDAGIIHGRREGRWNYYSLDLDALSEVQECVEALRTPVRRAQRKAACCD